MEGLRIREAAAADRPAILDLILALNRHEDRLTGDRRTDAAGAEAALAESEARILRGGGVALVADRPGRGVVGVLLAPLEQAPAYTRPALARRLWVAELVVAEDFRGKGIGAALLREAERWARDARACSLMISAVAANAPALLAYRRFGFEDDSVTLQKRLT